MKGQRFKSMKHIVFAFALSWLAITIEPSLLAQSPPIRTHAAPTADMINVSQPCTGSDIGAKIDYCLQTYGAQGTYFIPDGTYTFSTPILITQSGNQRMTLQCSGRGTRLNYVGSGAAIVVSSTSFLQSVTLANCSLDGSGATAGAVGVYAHITQNLTLSNMYISNFSGENVLGQGSIGSLLLGTDLFGGGVNLKLENDDASDTGSNSNRMIGGSLQYGSTTNFWDAGKSTSNGGDADNVLNHVLMEEHPPVPNAIIEGTWSDGIINSYIECLYQPSNSDYYNVIVGNKAASGYGSQEQRIASMFHFADNYAGTCEPGPGHTSALLDIINSVGLHVSGIRDGGYLVYGYVFDPAGTNASAVIEPSSIGWGTALYKDPPPDAMLHQDGGQPLSGAEYNSSANGYSLGSGLALFGGAWRAPLVSPINQVQFPEQPDGISPSMDVQLGDVDLILGYVTGDATNHGVIQQYTNSKNSYYDLFIQPKGGNLTLGNEANQTVINGAQVSINGPLVVNGTLGSNETPVSSATPSNYSIPIVINGKTYYLRLSSTP